MIDYILAQAYGNYKADFEKRKRDMTLQTKPVRMRKIRESQGISKAELARMAKMSNGTVGQIESGRLKPYLSQALKIARVLNWQGDPAKLFEEVAEDDVAAD